MARYRLKSAEVEAFQLPATGTDPSAWNAWAASVGFSPEYASNGVVFTNSAGQRFVAVPGYWVVATSNGLFLAFSPAEFDSIYEPVA